MNRTRTYLLRTEGYYLAPQLQPQYLFPIRFDDNLTGYVTRYPEHGAGY